MRKINGQFNIQNIKIPGLGGSALMLAFFLCVGLACTVSRPKPVSTHTNVPTLTPEPSQATTQMPTEIVQTLSALLSQTPVPAPIPAMGKSWAAPPTSLPTVTFPPPVEDQAILDQAEQSFQQGHEAYNSGYLQQAMDAFNAALEKNPRYALAYQYRGWTYLKQNTSNYLGTYLETNDKAILDLTRSIALDPVQWLPYYGRGIAFHNRAQVEPLRDNRKQWQALALADLDRAVELDQEQGRVRGERVEIYLEQGQCDMALDDLMSPYWSNITQSDEILYYIRTYLCQKNYSEADRLVNEELANGATANLYWERAMVYVGQKDYEKALQDMDSATQIQAGSFVPGTMLYTRAAIEYFLGEDDLALQDIQEGQNQTWIDWGTPYYFLGKIYLKRGDTLQAMSAFLWAEQTLEEGSLLNATRDELRQLGVYPTQTPTPTATVTETLAPGQTPKPTPLPTEEIGQIYNDFETIVYIQANATLLNITAAWIQSGAGDDKSQAFAFHVLDEINQEIDESIPQAVVPQTLKADWKMATSIHGQVKDIYQRWTKHKIGPAKVEADAQPLLIQIDKVVSDCEQIMATQYGFDTTALEAERQKALADVTAMFAPTPTPTP